MKDFAPLLCVVRFWQGGCPGKDRFEVVWTTVQSTTVIKSACVLFKKKIMRRRKRFL